MSPGLSAQGRSSRRGCLTCRIRRIKCDETQPACLKCVKTGRTCEGPATDLAFRRYVPKRRPVSSTEDLVFVRPPSSKSISATETRAFDFFIHQAAPDMSGSLDGAFWSQILPQLCLQDRTIRRAVLAVSIFHEHPLNEAVPVLSRDQVRGITWYEQSVAAALTATASEHDIEQLEHTLITCMLFIIIEMQNGSSWNAMHLHQRAFGLIALYFRKLNGRATISPWMSHILPMFARTTSQIGFRIALPPDHDEIVINLLPTSSDAIATLADARDTSHYIANRALMLARALGSSEQKEPTDAMVLEQQAILEWLATWEEKMLRLKRTTVLTPAMRRLYHALFCHEKGLLLFVTQFFAISADSQQNEAVFKDILDHAEESLDATPPKSPKFRPVPFMLEPGIIPGLCFVGWQCKDECTRQRATDLMKRAVKRENLHAARGQVDAIAGILKGDPTKYDRSSQNGFCEDIFASLSP